MESQVKILGFAGSLRTESFNKKIIKATLKIAQDQSAETEFVDLRDLEIPLYDADLQEKEFPKGAQILKDKVRAADAVIICSPEYNHAAPGVLKNALNWSSRPFGDAAFEGKLIGLMSASPGRFGGARALIDLQNSLNEMGAWVFPKTVSIPSVKKVLDDKGNIVDERLIESVQKFISGLIASAKRSQPIREAKP